MLFMLSKIERLDELIKEGEQFDWNNFSRRRNEQYGGPDTPEWLTWKTRVNNFINSIVGPRTAPTELLRRANNIGTEGNERTEFNSQKEYLLAALNRTKEALVEDGYSELYKPQVSESDFTDISNRIFVVHGHDVETKNELEIFLNGIGLEPIILHRQPDQGRTIIEKLEDYADVGFAFILLTPDEVAYTMSEEKVEDSKRKKEIRARPNVIFEFGYFAAKLGRNRVCCLVKGDVSHPSDIDGLVYKRISTNIEGIGIAIIKELIAAGYTINMGDIQS